MKGKILAMIVDVITRHAVTNYGSLLQTYATQATIEKLGHEVEIIDYIKYDERASKVAKASLGNSKFWNKNKIYKMTYLIMQTPNFKYMYKRFEKMRKNLIKTTNLNYGNLKELKENVPIADVYCTGSDQVWGKIGMDDFDKAYFLDFVPKGKKCISYAASLGKEKINEELDEKLKKLLEKYAKILVREQSAVDIIKSKGFDNVDLVLDPTLLLTREEWENVIKREKIRKKCKQKYILIYQLHRNKEFDKYAKKMAKKKNMKLIRVTPSILHGLKSGKILLLPNLSEFLNAFKNAEYILTDSFHATVFSIIFNKKFIDIMPEKTGTRIKNILQLTGIENRILKEYNDFESIDKKIDYNNVNQILQKERKKSIDLLKKAIEN